MKNINLQIITNIIDNYFLHLYHPLIFMLYTDLLLKIFFVQL